MFASTESLCQSKKYPIVRIDGKDTVVVMTVKQADAINSKYKTQETYIDSLKKCIAFANKQIDSLKSIKPKSDCDSLLYIINDWAYKPSLLYHYNGRVHSLDLSLYKIKFTTKGSVEITKLSKKEMSKYHQLLHSGGNNLIDWRQQFIYFELPLIGDIEKFK